MQAFVAGARSVGRLGPLRYGAAPSPAARSCTNINNNVLPGAGVGVMQLTENTAPGDINVVQASAALAAANSNATVTVTGAPDFGTPTCPTVGPLPTLPP